MPVSIGGLMTAPLSGTDPAPAARHAGGWRCVRATPCFDPDEPPPRSAPVVETRTTSSGRSCSDSTCSPRSSRTSSSIPRRPISCIGDRTVVNGDIRIWDDANHTILGDVIRFTDANGALNGQTADRMIFYSDFEPGELVRALVLRRRRCCVETGPTGCRPKVGACAQRRCRRRSS